MERREFTRVPFDARASLLQKSREASGAVMNLSLSGLFLRTEKRFDLGSDVDVIVFLSGDSSELTINMKGRIVRHEVFGMAVSFSMREIELDSLVHLRNVVAYNTGNDEEIIREYTRFLDRRGDSTT
jgi:predicted nucleotidyltransferase